MLDQQPPPPAEPLRQAGEPGAAGRIRIAIAQTPVTTDPREDGAAVRAAMHTAAGQGARLVHFTGEAKGNELPQRNGLGQWAGSRADRSTCPKSGLQNEMSEKEFLRKRARR